MRYCNESMMDAVLYHAAQSFALLAWESSTTLRVFRPHICNSKKVGIWQGLPSTSVYILVTFLLYLCPFIAFIKKQSLQAPKYSFILALVHIPVNTALTLLKLPVYLIIILKIINHRTGWLRGLGHLLLLQRIRTQFLAPTQWFSATWNSFSKVSNTLFSPLWPLHMWYTSM